MFFKHQSTGMSRDRNSRWGMLLHVNEAGIYGGQKKLDVMHVECMVEVEARRNSVALIIYRIIASYWRQTRIMPVSDIPIMLDNLLKTLLRESQLLSWQIFDDKTSNIVTGPQLGSVERCPSQTVVQVRHAQAQVCHRQFNTYQAKLTPSCGSYMLK